MLILCVFNRLKKSTKEHEDATKKWGLKINDSNSMFLSECNKNIIVNGVPMEHVQMLKYIGSFV